MVKWKIFYTKRAQDDSLKLKRSGLQKKTEELLQIISEDPYQTPPAFEKLVGVEHTYSRRINIQHRLVYQINKDDKTIVVKMMYKHYGDG